MEETIEWAEGAGLREILGVEVEDGAVEDGVDGGVAELLDVS